jgi:hypothetical protein
MLHCWKGSRALTIVLIVFFAISQVICLPSRSESTPTYADSLATLKTLTNTVNEYFTLAKEAIPSLTGKQFAETVRRDLGATAYSTKYDQKSKRIFLFPDRGYDPAGAAHFRNLFLEKTEALKNAPNNLERATIVEAFWGLSFEGLDEHPLRYHASATPEEDKMLARAGLNLEIKNYHAEGALLWIN